jgi:hypothetical protein
VDWDGKLYLIEAAAANIQNLFSFQLKMWKFENIPLMKLKMKWKLN